MSEQEGLIERFARRVEKDLKERKPVGTRGFVRYIFSEDVGELREEANDDN